jgi:hypothetical protein
VAAVPTDAGTLPVLPVRNSHAYFVDDARDFVSWNARILNFGPLASFVSTSLWQTPQA